MMRVESWIVSRSSTRTGTDFCPVIHSTRGTWKPGRSERRTCAMPFQSSAQRAFSLKCEKRNCQRTGGAITHDLGQTIRRVKTGGNPGGPPRHGNLALLREGDEQVGEVVRLGGVAKQWAHAEDLLDRAQRRAVRVVNAVRVPAALPEWRQHDHPDRAVAGLGLVPRHEESSVIGVGLRRENLRHLLR